MRKEIGGISGGKMPPFPREGMELSKKTTEGLNGHQWWKVKITVGMD